MAQTYKVDRRTRLAWPRCCAVCGSPEIIAAKVYGSTVDDFAIPYGVSLRVTEYALSFPYPVCRRHKRLWFLTRAALYCLVFVAALGLALAFERLPEATAILWILALAAGLAFWALAVALPPVRIFRIRDDYYMLRIRSDAYALALERANADKLGVW